MGIKLRSLVLGADLGHVDLALLLVRLWFGLALALGHGLPKLLNMERFTAGVTRHGMPLPELLAPLAMLSELLGGLLIAVGLLTRPAAAFALTTMLVAGFKVHAGDPFSKKELAFTYALLALAVLIAGPGRYSLDRRIAARR